MAIKDQSLLHDSVRFACTKQDKLFGHRIIARESKKLIDAKFNEIRNSIISARRFVLNNNLVETAALVAAGDPKFLLRSLPSALPPYSKCWFEWNENVRMNAMYSDHQLPFLTDDRAGRIGVLVEKLNRPGTDTLYSISVMAGQLYDEPEDSVAMYPIGFLVDFEKLEYTGSMTPDEILATLYIGRVEKKLQASIALGGTYFNLVTEEEKMVAMEIARHVRYKFAGPIGNWAKENWNKNEELESFAHQVNGDFRFILAVLVLLNTFAFQIDTAKVIKPTGKKIISGRVLPYMDYHEVVLELPKEKLLLAIEHHVGDSLNDDRRRHDVMEHWCYRKNSGNKNCEHEWLRLQDRTANIWHNCTKCGRVRWRRTEHQRGNAEKGYVQKDYILKGNRNKSVTEI